MQVGRKYKDCDPCKKTEINCVHLRGKMSYVLKAVTIISTCIADKINSSSQSPRRKEKKGNWKCGRERINYVADGLTHQTAENREYVAYNSGCFRVINENLNKCSERNLRNRPANEKQKEDFP